MTSTPITDVKHRTGDPSPVSDNLFWIRRKRNRDVWGTQNEIVALRKKRSEWQRGRPRSAKRKAYMKAYYSRRDVLDRINARAQAKRDAIPKRKWMTPDQVKQRRLEQSRAYYKQNRDKITARAFQKRRTNIRHRIADNLRRRVRTAIIRYGNGKKADRTFALLGCSIGEFVKHLEAQFKEGMSWSNMGEWEIEHILPLAMFHLQHEREQRQAFNFRNMRPEWAADNLKKSDKIEGELFRGRELRKVIQFNAA